EAQPQDLPARFLDLFQGRLDAPGLFLEPGRRAGRRAAGGRIDPAPGTTVRRVQPDELLGRLPALRVPRALPVQPQVAHDLADPVVEQRRRLPGVRAAAELVELLPDAQGRLLGQVGRTRAGAARLHEVTGQPLQVRAQGGERLLR